MTELPGPPSGGSAPVQRPPRTVWPPAHLPRLGPLLDGPLPVLFLLAIYYLALLTSVSRMSPTFDETAHLTGGLSYWIAQDYRLQPENGVLPQRWGTLPLYLSKALFPSRKQDAWRQADVWQIGHQFLFESGNAREPMVQGARMMMALIGLALCAMVWAWSRRLFGARGGLISLGMAALSPTLLAHGALVTSDCATGLFLLLSVGLFWRMLYRPTAGTVFGSALATGALFVTKMSAPLVLPMMALMLLVRGADRRPWELRLGRHTLAPRGVRRVLLFAGVALVQLCIVVGVIWAAYGFKPDIFSHPVAGQDSLQVSWQTLTADAGPVPGLLAPLRRLHLLPEPFLYGFSFMLHASQGRLSFLNGNWTTEGSTAFFPYALLTKTPLATFLIFGLAIGALVYACRHRPPAPTTARPRPASFPTAPLWILLLVYGSMAIGSRLNIGHRHLLPIYPALFILCGASAHWWRESYRVARLALSFALCLYLLEAGLAWPSYLAYFNPLAGGTRGAHRHMVDSSLDWGQDLPGLKRWLEREAPAGLDRPRVYLSYFGSADPAYYELKAELLPCYPDYRNTFESFHLIGGIYCISATMLQSIYSADTPGAWTAAYEAEWRQLVTDFGTFKTARNTRNPEEQARLLAGKSPDAWSDLCWRHEGFRLGRLCAYLRGRVPDDTIGGSILIYRLTAADLVNALEGPLAGPSG